MKLLLLCPIGIGNYLLAYPAFRMLREARPEDELHLLALRHSIIDIAGDDPLWNAVHVIDPTRDRSASQRARLLYGLTREKFDASISFFPSNTWQYNLLPFLCGVKKRFAFGYPLKKGGSFSFLNSRMLPIDPQLHDIDQNLRMVPFFCGEPLTESKADVFPRLFTERESEASLRYLTGLGAPPRYIGIHPGSSGEHGMAAKRWDPMRFGELADQVCTALGARALIFGSGNEERSKHITSSVMKAPSTIVEPVDLRTTAAIISRCTLMLCNDSGLMHIAACMGVPVIALFGPTDERRNGPAGEGHCILRHEMPGFPLWTAANVGVRSVADGVDPAKSLRALSVDEAWAKVAPWLKRFQAPASSAAAPD